MDDSASERSPAKRHLKILAAVVSLTSPPPSSAPQSDTQPTVPVQCDDYRQLSLYRCVPDYCQHTHGLVFNSSNYSPPILPSGVFPIISRSKPLQASCVRSDPSDIFAVVQDNSCCIESESLALSDLRCTWLKARIYYDQSYGMS